MDTKVEQEVFGYDPSNPEGLDSLHGHIHTEWQELNGDAEGIQTDELSVTGAGRGHSLPQGFAELEERCAAAVAAGQVPQSDAERELANWTGTDAERVQLKEATFLERYGTPTGTRTGRLSCAAHNIANVPKSR